MGSPAHKQHELLERSRAVRARLGEQVRRTPTIYSHTISERVGARVFLKLENLQRTGAFKLRGALNKLLELDEAVRSRGLVAASAGNHAQGVALAAKLIGVPATVFMPESTPLVKIRRTRAYGGQVELRGATWDESQAHAWQAAEAQGRTLVHPFDDAHVIEGQGTVALEILDDLPQLGTLVVPIGGGGLAAGVLRVAKAYDPKIRVVGVQAEGAAAMKHSLDAGRIIAQEHPRTIAEGIRVGTPGCLTFEHLSGAHDAHGLDQCVTVDEDQITEAVVQAMELSRVMVETAGVVGIAALMARKVLLAGDVCVIVSGGNIDLNLVARLIESGLARSGRTHLLKLRLADVPGELQRVLSVLVLSKANVMDVQHYRAGWKVPVGAVDVELLLETRHRQHGEEVEALLGEHGFDVRP